MSPFGRLRVRRLFSLNCGSLERVQCLRRSFLLCCCVDPYAASSWSRCLDDADSSLTNLLRLDDATTTTPSSSSRGRSTVLSVTFWSSISHRDGKATTTTSSLCFAVWCRWVRIVVWYWFRMRQTSPDRLLVTALRFIVPAQLKCTTQRSRGMSSRCWSVRRMSVFWPRWSISSCGRQSRVICSAFGSLTRYISLSVSVAQLCASWELLRPYAPTVIMILMVTVMRDRSFGCSCSSIPNLGLSDCASCCPWSLPFRWGLARWCVSKRLAATEDLLLKWCRRGGTPVGKYGFFESIAVRIYLWHAWLGC